MSKRNVLVDYSVEIEKDTFDKLDKKIQADKDVPEDEMKLWNDVRLLPEKYNTEFVKYIEEFIKKDEKHSQAHGK